jgi:large subunit ribosomal protein L18
MAIKNKKVQRRSSIRQRIRKIVKGSAERPRLTVFRSNQQIYVQLVDDLTGNTLISAGSIEKSGAVAKTNKVEQAKQIGKLIAEKALAAGIENVVFDRNGYLYHGRVKSLAEAAREGGLKF